MTATIASLDARRRGVGRLLKFCLGETRNTHRVKNVDLRWETLVERFHNPPKGTETGAEYLKMPVEVQLHLKDKGYFMPTHMDKGVRAKGNVHLRSCVVLDCDHAPEGAIERVSDVLVGLGMWKFCLSTTRKHRTETPRFRLIIPLTRDVGLVEYQAVSRYLAASIMALEDGVPAIDWFDDTGFEFTRVAFWPSISVDQDYVVLESDGDWVDPDQILGEYKDPTDIGEWPVSSRLKDKLRGEGRRSGNPHEKPGIIGAFNRTYTIHEAMDQFIPGVYTTGAHENRMTFAAGSSANGALIYDNDTFLFSRHESDPCYYQNCNAFDMVRIHLFGELDVKLGSDVAMNQRPSYKAMAQRASEDTDVVTEMQVARAIERSHDFDDFDIEPVSDDVVPSETPETDDEGTAKAPGTKPRPEDRKKAEEAWRRPMMEKVMVSDKGAIIPCLATLEAIFEYDPMLKGCVATNLFTSDLLQMKRLPGMRGKVPAEGVLWSDLAELKIKSYIERRHRLYVSATAVHEAAASIGDKYAFNPVRNRLDNLPAWDGADRIETFFIRHLGCPDTPYYRDVSRKFFVAAVSRVYRPGCKFDSMLVLEGPEGIGKSTLGKVLAYGYFTDEMSFGFDSKEVVERTRGSWIVEVPEMITRSNADSQHVLQFITRQVERVRLSYARNAGDYPRQFVMIGTTNETDDYLRTKSGNRRFWCIRCGVTSLDMAGIIAERDQLWAEALIYMALNEPMYLEGVALKEAQAVQAERVIKDDLSGVIDAWLNERIRAGHWDRDAADRSDFDDEPAWVDRDRVCAAEIWVECMKGQIDRFGRREAMRINDLMKGLVDWERKALVRFGKRYGKGRGYLRKVAL